MLQGISMLDMHSGYATCCTLSIVVYFPLLSSLHKLNQVDRLAVAVQTGLDECDVLQRCERRSKAIVLAVDSLEEARELEVNATDGLLKDLLVLADVVPVFVPRDGEDGDAECAHAVHGDILNRDPAVLAGNGDAAVRKLAARGHRGAPGELDDTMCPVGGAHDGVDRVVWWEVLLVL